MTISHLFPVGIRRAARRGLWWTAPVLAVLFLFFGFHRPAAAGAVYYYNLTVVKQAWQPNGVDPYPDDWSFDFTCDFNGQNDCDANFTLTDDNPSYFKQLYNYSSDDYLEISEDVPDGWTASVICKDGDHNEIAYGIDSVAFNPPPGDITCTFTNVAAPQSTGGTITVLKEAGDTGEQFEFNPSWSDDNFLLYSGESKTSDPLTAGNYSVEEVNLPPGWSLEDVECVNEANETLPTAPASAIPVEDGDEWVCTFTNVYSPPPLNVCPSEDASSYYTDILGTGMGSPGKHRARANLNIPGWMNVETLYGQLVAKDDGKAKYVRFILPGKNNYVQVNAITSPIDHNSGIFWYGDYIEPAQWVKGRWFLQANGAKGHIPRAFILYPTYAHPTNTYVNVWDTFHASEGEVYWDVYNGWTPYREIIVPIAPNTATTTFHVELAVVDNDKDNRRVWVTVTAGNVWQIQSPSQPDAGDTLNLLTFDLEGVEAGTDEIVIEIASYQGDGAYGDSAALVGMAAHYVCAPLGD